MKRLLILALLLAAGMLQAADNPAVTESITVSTTAVGLSTATLGAAGSTVERTSCTFTLETANVRWRVDGKDPDTNTGHIFIVGGMLSIDGNLNLRRLKFIRDDASDGIVTASCW